MLLTRWENREHPGALSPARAPHLRLTPAVPLRTTAPRPRAPRAPRSQHAPGVSRTRLGPLNGAGGGTHGAPALEHENTGHHLLSESVAGFLPRAGLGGLEKRFSKSILLPESRSYRLTTTAAGARRGVNGEVP